MEEDIKTIQEKLKIIESLCTDDCINKSTVIQPLIYAIQNLIARYKKLEENNKTLETLLQGNLYQMYLYYKELAGRYQANSISKDKVKAKIEEVSNGTYDAKIVLQSLLEKE